MKKHKSRLFGAFTYKEEQIIEFPLGLLGFPDHTRYVLKRSGATDPVCWLLSVEENGPELAVVDPAVIGPEYGLSDLQITGKVLRTLHTKEPNELVRLAIVTLPENIKHMSMNLRTPILIDSQTRRGIQYESSALDRKPIRCLIYRDLIASSPEDKPGTLVIHRRPNETIDIGDEISIQVLEFANGGVRLGVSAPRRMKVGRGDGRVTPVCETERANEVMDIDRLKGIMKMHQIMHTPVPWLKQAHTSADERVEAI